MQARAEVWSDSPVKPLEPPRRAPAGLERGGMVGERGQPFAHPVNERPAHASHRVRNESVPYIIEQDRVQGVVVGPRAHPALEVRQLVAERFADEHRVQVKPVDSIGAGGEIWPHRDLREPRATQ